MPGRMKGYFVKEPAPDVTWDSLLADFPQDIWPELEQLAADVSVTIIAVFEFEDVSSPRSCAAVPVGPSLPIKPNDIWRGRRYHDGLTRRNMALLHIVSRAEFPSKSQESEHERNQGLQSTPELAS